MDNRGSATSVQGLGDRTAEDEHEDLLPPRRQARQVRNRFFLCDPFDGAQDMLCAFAGDVPNLGCGFASLGPCDAYCFTVNPEQLLF